MDTRTLIALVCALAACGSDPGTPDADVPDADVLDAAPDAPDAEPGPVTGVTFLELSLESPGAVTDFAFLPGTDDLLATEHQGTVVHYRLEGDGLVRLGSFDVPDVGVENECGLISVTIDPDWATNGYVYLGYCAPAPEFDTVISRVTFDGTSHDSAPDTLREVLTYRDTRGRFPFNHSMGSMGFEPDGTMFVFMGDKTYEPGGQDLENMGAALIRIIPNREPEGSGYEPAPDNPVLGGATEIYAYGMRNGWRGYLDQRGRYWFADVGNVEAEEINVLLEPGQNFGWPECEGACDPARDDIVDPLTQWGRDVTHPYFADDPDTEPSTRRAAWLGGIYEPDGADRYDGFLADKVWFGDMCLGWVRTLLVDESSAVLEDEFLGHLAHLVGWRVHRDGYIYLATFGSCDAGIRPNPARFYRVVPSRAP